jgi:hypothetical protein
MSDEKVVSIHAPEEGATVELPNIVIPPHHRKTQKEHPADKAIMDAAREIDEGNWTPPPDPERDQAMAGIGLALGIGTSGVAIGAKPALEEFQHTANLDLIGRHPRVVEALEKMRTEIYKAPDPHAALEHNFAQRELAEAAAASDKWDGQGRWEGRENEEMRYGKLLTPVAFYDQLGKVTGKGRIKLGEHLVRTSRDARSGRIGLFVRNPEWKGDHPIIDDRSFKIRDLRTKGVEELKRAKELRKLGFNSDADKKVALAGDMAQEAMRLNMEVSVEEQMRPPELLRVGTLQWPVGTEWMIMAFTEWGAVWQAKYIGWRTALLTMIRAGAITEKEAHKAFPVASGPAAAWYLEQLAMMRNAEGTIQ